MIILPPDCRKPGCLCKRAPALRLDKAEQGAR